VQKIFPLFKKNIGAATEKLVGVSWNIPPSRRVLRMQTWIASIQETINLERGLLMKQHNCLMGLGVAMLVGFSQSSIAAGDASHGQALYQSLCAACHTIDYNGAGPAHKGLFDRKAGSNPKFLYSPSVKASTIIWTEDTLDKWLTNPEALIPGQKMGVSVSSAEDRADLIAYLKKETIVKP
jgi:cytochrome c